MLVEALTPPFVPHPSPNGRCACETPVWLVRLLYGVVRWLSPTHDRGPGPNRACVSSGRCGLWCCDCPSNDSSFTRFVCVICMCRDKTDTRPTTALEPRQPAPTGAHTSSIGPQSAIMGGWKHAHTPLGALQPIASQNLVRFAK